MKVLVRPDEDFLSEVLSIFRGGSHPSDESEHAVLIEINELGEGIVLLPTTAINKGRLGARFRSFAESQCWGLKT